MNKFYGPVGFGVSTQIQTQPGVWELVPVEKSYRGDILKNDIRKEGSNVNDNFTMSSRISIVADPYAFNNSHLIRYVKFRGVAWKVTSIEEQYPRLILNLGGLYHVDSD